jgi:hypothetical protein
LRIPVTAAGHQAQFVTPLDAAQLQRDIGNFLDDIAHRRDPGGRPQTLYELMLRRVDDFAAATQRALRLGKGPNGGANADPYYWAGFFVASSHP